MQTITHTLISANLASWSPATRRSQTGSGVFNLCDGSDSCVRDMLHFSSETHMHPTQPDRPATRKLALRSLSCFLLAVLLCSAVFATAQSGFVHTQGKQLVDGAGKPLLLRGTNLGDWLVPEGYMLKFDGGPQSPRQIEALTQTLLGPEESVRFWQSYRSNYITRDDIQFIQASPSLTL
jgi:hypothetical protein